MKTFVENVQSNSGRAVANQFIITTEKGQMFQSYNSNIAFIPNNGDKIVLGKNWDYSVTTGKYRNAFLGETKKETEKKLKNGEYILNENL